MVEVFFDYTCGFSNRAGRWLDAVAGHGGACREGVANALAVHEAVRAAGGDVDAPPSLPGVAPRHSGRLRGGLMGERLVMVGGDVAGMDAATNKSGERGRGGAADDQ